MDNKINATPEQLKDPKWWDENAPNGTEALLDYNQWVKWVHGEEFWWSVENPYWMSQSDNSWSAERYKGKPKTFPLHERPVVAEQKDKEWIPGVTLPPVGTKCRIHLTDPSFYYEVYPTIEQGMEVEIIQHLNIGSWRVAAVFKYLSEYGYYCVAQANAEGFVPLKTQEQIEEEETKKVIESVVGGQWLHWSPRLIADALYDAGVRLIK